MNNTIQELEAKINNLEAQLQEAKAFTYVDATDTLHAQDGAIHLGYNNGESFVVWDVQSLFEDLPTIIQLVREQQEKATQKNLSAIDNELNKL